MAILDLDISETPSTPQANAVKLFFDKNNDDHLTQIDSLGRIIDITKPSALMQADNQIVINEVSDLPPPVGGVHILQDNKNYIQGADLIISDRIRVGSNGSWTTGSTFGAKLTYTGTGIMWTGVDVNFTISKMQMTCPNASECFNFSSPTFPGGNIVRIEDVGIEQCNKLATLNNLQVFEFFRSAALNCTDGITVLGKTNWNVFSYQTLLMITSSATFIGTDFADSVHNSLILINPLFIGVAGSIGIKAESDSSNMTAGNLAIVRDGEFFSPITPLSGVEFSSIRWNFQNNSNIRNTISDALLGFDGNALVTTISAVNTPVKINAVWVVEDVSKFTADTTGTVICIGEQTNHLPIDIQVSVISVGGASKQVKVYLAVDGSVISSTGRTITVSGSNAQTINIPWQRNVIPLEELEVFLENITDEVDLIAQSAIFRIN